MALHQSKNITSDNLHDFAIVGGGYSGLIAGFLLSSHHQQNRSIALLEAGKKFGGIMQSIAWKNFLCDPGCHLIDNTHPRVTPILEALTQNQLKPLQVRNASRFRGKIAENIAVPDLTALPQDIHEQILQQTLACAQKTPPLDGNLHDYITERWGEVAVGYLKQIVKKMSQQDAETLDAISRNYMPLQRIKIADTETSLALKQKDPHLDAIMAVAAMPNSMQFYPDAQKICDARFLYPTRGGMQAITDSGLELLRKRNVLTKTESAITRIEQKNGQFTLYDNQQNTYDAKHIFWSSGLSILEKLLWKREQLKQYETSCGVLLAYFSLPKEQISPLTYFHQYDDDMLLFRFSSGLYTPQQQPHHESYICMEVPMREDVFARYDRTALTHQLWQEAQTLNLVQAKNFSDSKLLYIPRAFRLFRPGYAQCAEAIMQQMNEQYPHIICLDPKKFGRTAITLNIIQQLQPFIGDDYV